jgi:hypothetical protein
MNQKPPKSGIPDESDDRAFGIIWQQGRDDRPFEIGQFVAALAHVRSSKELESPFARKRNPLYEFVT